MKNKKRGVTGLKLSIIICLYNTDRELFSGALKSVCECTLSPSEYEICIVDDGSSVDYSDIIEKYKAEKINVKYVKSENRGILLARARGVELSEGEYITFLDSDDTVSANYHLAMLTRAGECGADIVLGDWAFHSDTTRYFCKNDTTVTGEISLTSTDILKAFLGQEGRLHSYFVLWNKIFSSQLLKKAVNEALSSVKEAKGYNYSEDALISFFAFRSAKKVVNVHTGYYYYRIHASQTVKVADRKKLLSHIECMAKTLSVMKDVVSVCDVELLTCINNWASLMSRTHYSYARAGGYVDLYPIIKELYGVEKLKPSTLADGKAYRGAVLIAENVSEIDKALLKLYKADTPPTVSYSCRDAYTVRNLAFFDKLGVRYEKRDNSCEIVIPRERVSFKKRIFMNKFVWTLGMLLFPKGSRIRSLLKSRL